MHLAPSALSLIALTLPALIAPALPVHSMLAPPRGESGTPAVVESVDPKDGPDIDLRIAIEDDEVRMQIITNLAFLDEELGVFREMQNTLDPAEAPAAMASLFELFKRENRVEIDGTLVPPLPVRVEDSFEFDPGEPSLYPLFERFEARAVAKTRLTLRFPCKSPPKNVAFTWGVYPPNLVLQEPDGSAPPIQVTCRLIAGGVERIVFFNQEEPEYTWHREADEGRARFEAVPEISEQVSKPFPWPFALGGVACFLGMLLGPQRLRRPLFGPLTVGLAAYTAVLASARAVELPTELEAVSIFKPLHENIYRAFDYTDESDVYDALGQSVDGALLEHLYDQVYRSLVLQEEGGAVSRVAAVRHVELDVESVGVVGDDELPGFTINTLWQVDGVVFHWGHAHSRTNEYRARYTVHAAEAGWRIAASQVLEQRRVDAAPMSDLEFQEKNGWTGFGDKDGPPPEDF